MNLIPSQILICTGVWGSPEHPFTQLKICVCMLMFIPEGSSPLVSMFKRLKYNETFKFKPLLLCNLGLFFFYH